jgi:hypothetical protein
MAFHATLIISSTLGRDSTLSGYAVIQGLLAKKSPFHQLLLTTPSMGESDTTITFNENRTGDATCIK